MCIAMDLEGIDIVHEASKIILAHNNSITFAYIVYKGCTAWDNLYKVLLVNTLINNSQRVYYLV